MKYTLVKPDGTLGKSYDFDGVAPILSPNKGRWVVDVEPIFDSTTHIIQPVEPVPADAVSIPYIVASRDIDTLRLDKIAEIETTRDAETVKNVTANGTQWQADERSQKLLGDAITLANAGLPLPTIWRDALNNEVQITTIAQLLSIASAIAAQTTAAYTKSWQKKAEIQNATTVEALLGISWTSQ